MSLHSWRSYPALAGSTTKGIRGPRVGQEPPTPRPQPGVLEETKKGRRRGASLEGPLLRQWEKGRAMPWAQHGAGVPAAEEL